MLNENIKAHRKAKGLSQEELAVKLNVVRQTLSKWEKGQSVPDAELLIKIAEALDTSVSELLGEPCPSENDDTIKILAEKLEILNKQYSERRKQKRKLLRAIFIVLAAFGVVYLIDRIITAGIILRAMGVGANVQGDIPTSLYSMMIHVCIRILLPPSFICVLAAIGICKTKTDA